MSLDEMINLFPPHSRGMARFMALAEAVLRQVKDLQDAAASIGAAFSFGEAVGVQLDAIGESVGMARGNGWGDEQYRGYLLQKMKIYRWDGTNEGAADVLPEGVRMVDHCNGSVTVSPVGSVAPVPAGVWKEGCDH